MNEVAANTDKITDDLIEEQELKEVITQTDRASEIISHIEDAPALLEKQSSDDAVWH